MVSPVRLVLLSVIAMTVVVTACAPTRSNGDGIRIEAAFHPLAYLARRVGGERVRVHDLTRPGVDAHHGELRARDIGAMIDADLVLHLSGFQPSIDAAIPEVADHALDVAASARLRPVGDDEDHDEHGPDDDHDHQPGAPDPHFWLDPGRMADVALVVRDRLIAIDPEGAATYRGNTDDLLADLRDLTDRYEEGLADCVRRDVVVTHASFGYLTDRFGLTQVSVTGLVPVEDPSGSQLGRAVALVRDRGVTTIFREPLMSSRIADAVADEAGIDTAILDPIEGLADDAPGSDYLGIMDANLSALRKGLGCR